MPFSTCVTRMKHRGTMFAISSVRIMSTGIRVAYTRGLGFYHYPLKVYAIAILVGYLDANQAFRSKLEGEFESNRLATLRWYRYRSEFFNKNRLK
jgi:hypothetical protein